VQNNRELDYFHRILFGVSKAIAENIELGEAYVRVKKVYSVNIVYFGLGQGEDYIYKGRTDFVGLNNPSDVLKLTKKQQKQFCSVFAGDIFPEYYILRVDDFDKTAKTPLDEWISFLKTGDIPETATAPGLPEARQKLQEDAMTSEERLKYRSHLEALRYQRSVIKTGFVEGYDKGEEKGVEKGELIGEARERLNIAKKMMSEGMSVDLVSKVTGLSKEDIEDICSNA
jgi:predicted transposase/invertase (TIGR01784 family)